VRRAFKAALRRGKFCAWWAFRAVLSRRLDAGLTAIVYVFAERERYPNSRGFIEGYRRWLGDSQTTLVCVDNLSEAKEPVQTGKGVWDIGGDNSYREFSGWRKGLKFVEKLELQPDRVVFANDACLNYAHRGLDSLFFRMRFDKVGMRGARAGLLGVTERASDQHILLGQDVSSWVRCNFFCLPSKLASGLPRTFIPEDIVDRIIPPYYRGAVVNATPDTNEAFREFLTIWITRRWHRAMQPTAEAWPMLRKKLIAMLNERMLTASVRRLGYDVIEASRLRWT